MLIGSGLGRLLSSDIIDTRLAYEFKSPKPMYIEHWNVWMLSSILNDWCMKNWCMDRRIHESM